MQAVTISTHSVSLSVSEMKTVVKKRNWAMVLYPDSAPDDWRERLAKTGLQCAVSPLHDRDVDPTGEKKKAHYHVILCYSGPTAYSVVERLAKSLNQPIPQALEQVRGYYRYLTHADNPEKAQYSPSDIVTINGFDIRDFVELSKSEVLKSKKEIMMLIRDNEITEYADLMDVLLDGGEATADMFDVASSNTLFFTKYIASRRYKVTGISRGDD